MILRPALAAGPSALPGLAYASEVAGGIPEYSPPWMVLVGFVILALICFYWAVRD